MGIENEEDPLVNITSQKLSLVSIIIRLQYNKKMLFNSKMILMYHISAHDNGFI